MQIDAQTAAAILTSIGAVGMIVIGLRKKSILDVAIGGGFLAGAVVGHLIQLKETFSWLQGVLGVCVALLVLVKIYSKSQSRHSE